MAEQQAPTHSRRDLLAAASSAVALTLVANGARAEYHDDGDADAAIRNIAAGRPVTPGRVKLTLPELAENGNAVSLTVEVDSPMTAADHVAAIHIVAGKNPLANVMTLHLGPRSGRAFVKSNIRLATTQTVTAIAELNDGRLFSGTATVLVTISACIDGG